MQRQFSEVNCRSCATFVLWVDMSRSLLILVGKHFTSSLMKDLIEVRRGLYARDLAFIVLYCIPLCLRERKRNSPDLSED